MKVIIEISPEKDSERVLNYFYEKCLLAFELGEFERFEVKIESEEGQEMSKVRKFEPPKSISKEHDEELEEIESGE